MTQISRREWLWAVAVAGLVVAFSTVPYGVGYLAQTPELRFDGALMDQMDYRSHLAKMWQGYRGEWRYRLLFTPEEHQGAYLQLFYVSLGHVARIAQLGLPLTYQVARVIFGFVMLLTIYRFIAHFASPVRVRRMAFLLATSASGLGWLTETIARTPSGGVSPMDFWLLDGFIYLALLTSPHFCLAITLLLAIFIVLLRHPEGPSLKDGALAALLSVALGLVHPYMLLVADTIPLLHWAVDGFGTRRMWKGLQAVVAMGVFHLPLVAYDLWVFRARPVFAGWSAQNVTLSPPLWVYLCGYGLLLVLGLIGVLAWDRYGGRDRAFLLLWMGAVAMLVYVPWNLQRRFLEGVQVPLGLLGGVGLVRLSGSIAQLPKRQWVVKVTVISLAAMSNLYLTASLILAAATRTPILFWPHDSLAGMEWLGENASWNETVLAGPQTGSLIPATIGHRVVIGHWMETLEYEQKQVKVAGFFSDDLSEADRLALVKEWRVEWMFYGPEERGLDGLDLESVPWLKPVFWSGEVVVCRVSTSNGS